MRLDEHIVREEIIPHPRGRKLKLFYYEQVNSRSYLRITKLGLVIVLVFTVLPVIALLSLFLLNQSTPMPNVDVTIKPMPTANDSIYYYPPTDTTARSESTEAAQSSIIRPASTSIAY